SDISHQLKTPLSALILNHDILLTRKLSQEQSQTFLLSNQNQLNRIQWLIQNLLKLAKIDADAVELELEEDSLNETIEEAIEILESKAREEKVTIDFRQTCPVLMKHDRLWLQEALINVIKNGIEHSEEGDVVTVELEENPIFTRIIVRDQGDGIEEKDLTNIFNRFYKVKNKKKNDSVGIGLSMAKSIIEKHKGYIEAKSKGHEGTIFLITFIKHE
ncbi:MAG TPA: sensor histidine kinase, partial [Paenibacillaceae bacterium]|nr:sensor histidine kinase [Paenibacillaceae bacterium]